MIGFARMPSSIAVRVCTGRRSMARRSSLIGSRRTGRERYAPRELLPPGESDVAMRLGVNVGYWGLGASPEENLAMVLEAEKLGFDSVWAAEAYGSDAATVLAWLASQTQTIKLGSGIF